MLIIRNVLMGFIFTSINGASSFADASIALSSKFPSIDAKSAEEILQFLGISALITKVIPFFLQFSV